MGGRKTSIKLEAEAYLYQKEKQQKKEEQSVPPPQQPSPQQVEVPKEERKWDFSYPTFASISHVGDVVVPPREEILQNIQRNVPSLREEGKLEDTFRKPLTQQILEKGKEIAEKIKQKDFPIIKSSFMSADVGIVTKPIEEVRLEAEKEKPIMASDVIKNVSQFTAGAVASVEGFFAPVPTLPGAAIEFITSGKSPSAEFLAEHPYYTLGSITGEVTQAVALASIPPIRLGKQLESDIIHIKSKIPDPIKEFFSDIKEVVKPSKETIAERTIFSQTDPLNAILLKQETEGMVPRIKGETIVAYPTREWKIVEKSPGVFDYELKNVDKVTRWFEDVKPQTQKGFKGGGAKTEFKFDIETTIEKSIEKPKSFEKTIEKIEMPKKTEQIATTITKSKTYEIEDLIIPRTFSKEVQPPKTLKPHLEFTPFLKRGIEEIKDTLKIKDTLLKKEEIDLKPGDLFKLDEILKSREILKPENKDLLKTDEITKTDDILKNEEILKTFTDLESPQKTTLESIQKDILITTKITNVPITTTPKITETQINIVPPKIDFSKQKIRTPYITIPRFDIKKLDFSIKNLRYIETINPFPTDIIIKELKKWGW